MIANWQPQMEEVIVRPKLKKEANHDTIVHLGLRLQFVASF